MKIVFDQDIYLKLVEAGFKEGEQLEFKKAKGEVNTLGTAPPPKEHPPKPPRHP